MEEFKAGDVVKILSSGQIGAVLRAVHNYETISYEVLVNGERLIIDCTQLKKENTEYDYFKTREEFDAMLTALAVTNPGNELFSLNTAKINFIPYQYRPVLKIIKSDVPRILIADDVGVGKTIEAGLIVKELSARQSMKNILIFCPKPLISEGKWVNEMRNKFDEKFEHLDRKMFRNAIKECDYEGEWVEEYSHCVIPFSILDEDILEGGDSVGKKSIGLYDLNPPPKFDLVIVDEAHHIRNQNTQAYKVVQYFCEHAEAVVFLTATPIQIGNTDLYVLLNLLRPDYIIDEETFKVMAEPNAYFNLAISAIRNKEECWKEVAISNLEIAASLKWCIQTEISSNIYDVIRFINDNNDSAELRVSAISEIEKLHSFSNIINRTRMRDVGNFTVRKPVTVRSKFSRKQKELYDALIETQTKILLLHYKEFMIKFLMSTLYRQASSCIFGLAPQIEEILSRNIWNDEEIYFEDEMHFEINNDIEKEIKKVLDIAANIDDTDEKYIALKRIIKEKSAYSNNKIMLFSAFRHTLKYLYKKLKSEGYRVGLVTGEVKDEERIVLRKKFMKAKEDSEAIDILLFSEVGCEGLDYQFCDCLINYDLPWNPMRIEQRIGRIDRNGQQSESILIYNMITEETVDADIYDRCLTRIGIFNQSLGCGEEILGSITKEIQDIAVDYTLSHDERNFKFRQLAENKIRLINENQLMEENQYDFLSLRMPFDEDKKNIQDFSSYWLMPEKLKNILNDYLDRKFGKQIIKNKTNEYFEINLDKDEKAILLNEYYEMKNTIPTLDKNWISFLRGDTCQFKFVFDSDLSKIYNTAFLISAIHPLVLMSSKKILTNTKRSVVMEYNYPQQAGKRVGFAIYEWRYVGDRSRSQIKIITDDCDSEGFLENMVREAKVVNKDIPGSLNTYSEIHRKKWQEEREKYRAKQINIYSKRQASLKLSFGKRLDTIEDQIVNNKNVNIVRMKKKEYENVNSDFKYRIQQLEEQKGKIDIISKFICSGIIMVVK